MNLITSISRALALIAAAAAIGARAANPDFNPQESDFAVSIETSPREPVYFWERFDTAFQSDVNDVFVDALSPLNAIRWNFNLPGRNVSQGFYDRTTSAADSALVDSIDYSTREAMVETPFVLWLDAHQGWFAELLRGSVDDVGEQSLSPLNASYRAVQQTWWRTLLQNGGTFYGIRPFSTSPYAYVSRGITDGGGNTVLLANVRYYYDHFSDHRIELSLSVPVAYGLSVDLGSAYRFGSNENNRSFAVQVLKEFNKHGIAHLGFEVRERPIIIAGVTFTW